VSATLRHDIPPRLAEAIKERTDVLDQFFSAQPAQRWAGSHRGHVTITTFAVKLPRHFGPAFELTTACKRVSDSGQSYVHTPAWTLQRKLTVSLGLPYNEFFDQPRPEEKAFLAALEKAPGEIATWSAYSDWLVEHDDPRGTLIAQLLDPKKAVKCKYGIPECVRHKLGR
jgi:uncharacterized protein (TIGR02996 family)